MQNELIIAVTKALYKEFGDNYTYYVNEVKQGLKVPCFFVYLVSGDQKQLVGNRYYRTHLLDICYIPSDFKHAELLDVADTLKFALEYVQIDDGLLRGVDMNHEIVDGVLHFFVNYNAHVKKVADEGVKMEEINVEAEIRKS